MPTYKSVYTFLYTLIIFLLSIIMLKTRKYEEQEAENKDVSARRAVDPIENVETMRNYQV